MLQRIPSLVKRVGPIKPPRAALNSPLSWSYINSYPSFISIRNTSQTREWILQKKKILSSQTESNPLEPLKRQKPAIYEDDDDFFEYQNDLLKSVCEVPINENAKTWKDLNVPDEIIQLLNESFGIKSPNEIQSKAIQAIVQDGDVMFQSETGSGKTLAYLLPILMRLMKVRTTSSIPSSLENKKKSLSSMILQTIRKNTKLIPYSHVIVVPTRELAMQVIDVLSKLLHLEHDVERLSSVIHPVLSGSDFDQQLKSVEKYSPPIVVVMPNVVNAMLDHTFGRYVLMRKMRMLVIDETDQVLHPLSKYATEKEKKIREIHPLPVQTLLSQLQKQYKRKLTKDKAQSVNVDGEEFEIDTSDNSQYSFRVQLVCASATVSARLRTLVNGLWPRIPLFLSAGKPFSIPKTISHELIIAGREKNTPMTTKLAKVATYMMDNKVTSALLFLPNECKIDEIVNYLNKGGINSATLHSSLLPRDLTAAETKKARSTFLRSFQSGDVKLVVTNESTARGLDFKDLNHIFILHLTADANSYLHLAGRTGRVGKAGTVVSVLTSEEKERFMKYVNYLQFPLKVITDI